MPFLSPLGAQLEQSALRRFFKIAKLLKRLAHPRGFEPLTSAFGGQRSIQLSYGCIWLHERI